MRTRVAALPHRPPAGQVSSVALVLPHEWVWPLPLYELALMTAGHARRKGVNAQFTFITSEARPLKAFGQAAGDAILRLLQRNGIRLHTGVRARVPARCFQFEAWAWRTRLQTNGSYGARKRRRATP